MDDNCYNQYIKYKSRMRGGNHEVRIILIKENKLIIGCVMNTNSNLIIKKFYPKNNNSSNNMSLELISYIFEYCKNKSLNVISIGISTKGSGHDHEINSLRDKLKKYKVPITIKNRFHSFALGVYRFIKSNVSIFAGVNLSDGVGYGVVNNGLLIEDYDKDKGVGGKMMIERKSDGKLKSIVNLAGIKTVRNIDFSNIENVTLIDATHAVSRLLLDLDNKYHPQQTYIMIYDKLGLSMNNKIIFLDMIKKYINIHMNIEIISGITENDAKIMGAW